MENFKNTAHEQMPDVPQPNADLGKAIREIMLKKAINQLESVMRTDA